jgi:hypothetical protein
VAEVGALPLVRADAVPNCLDVEKVGDELSEVCSTWRTRWES